MSHVIWNPVICWGTEWDAGPRPVRGPRMLIWEPQTVRCARGVRGPRRRTRRGSSHCDPQITLALSRGSPPSGGTRTGQSKGDTPTSSEEVSGAQHRHGHVPTVRTWLIHERCLSVPKAQARGAAIVTIRWSQEPTTSRNARAGSHL